MLWTIGGLHLFSWKHFFNTVWSTLEKAILDGVDDFIYLFYFYLFLVGVVLNVVCLFFFIFKYLEV